MTDQQQYRVIADRDKGDDPKVADIASGDRYTYESAYSSWTDMGDDDPLVRIERPVPTTDEPTCDCGAPLAVCTAACRGTGPSPSLPTREQIAEAIYGGIHDWSELSEWNQKAYLARANAVFTLLQNGADRG